jgi:spermidine synthase
VEFFGSTRVFPELAFPQRLAFNSQSMNDSGHDSSAGRLTVLARTALAGVGFSAVVGQVVLMRELIVAFNGNEISLGIMLAAWLFWTAAGSSLAGLMLHRIRDPRHAAIALELLQAATLLPTIWVLRESKTFFQSVPGELVGLLPMLISAFICLSVFCIVSGALFVVAARFFEHESHATSRGAAGSAYLLDAAGSAIGGVLASVLLLRFLDPFQIAFVVAILNLCIAVALQLKSRRRLALEVGIAVCAAIPLLTSVAPCLDKAARAEQWRGFNLVTSRDTIYGNLAVTQTGPIRSIYTDGVILANAPDPAAAEEAVHYALLEHPAPHSILLIGGGTNGAINEAFKHPSVTQVDYVELDPTLIELANEFLPAESPILSDPSSHAHLHAHTYLADGRRYLETTNRRYDVIVVNVADPQTAQLNRFYTSEFFRTAREHLAPGGMLAIQLRSAEETLSPDLKAFLRCIRRTLATQFPYIVAIPGATIHFVASTSPDGLTSDPQVLLDRMRRRRLNSQYVSQYFIPWRMAPDRMRQVDADLEPLPSTPVNRDFAPVAYYFNSVLWSAQFGSRSAELLRRAGSVPFGRILNTVSGILLVVVVLSAVMLRKSERPRWAAAGCTLATGFTLMALQILVLLGFESVYGYVYHQLAILIGLMMAGIAFGSWLALRRNSLPHSSVRHLAVVQFVLALAGPALLLAVSLLANLVGSAATWAAAQLAFPALAAIAGMVGGYQFVVAANVYLPDSGKSAGLGVLYALDLLGGCAGALVLSAWLIPVFGFWNTAWLLATVNLAATLVAALAGLASRTQPA